MKQLIDTITEMVCSFYEVTFEQVKRTEENKRRFRSIIYPRQVIEYCLKEIAFYPITEIGKYTGVDHATVISSAWRIQNDMDCGYRPGVRAAIIIEQVRAVVKDLNHRKEIEEKIKIHDPVAKTIEMELEECLQMNEVYIDTNTPLIPCW